MEGALALRVMWDIATARELFPLFPHFDQSPTDPPFPIFFPLPTKIPPGTHLFPGRVKCFSSTLMERRRGRVHVVEVMHAKGGGNAARPFAPLTRIGEYHSEDEREKENSSGHSCATLVLYALHFLVDCR